MRGIKICHLLYMSLGETLGKSWKGNPVFFAVFVEWKNLIGIHRNSLGEAKTISKRFICYPWYFFLSYQRQHCRLSIHATSFFGTYQKETALPSLYSHMFNQLFKIVLILIIRTMFLFLSYQGSLHKTNWLIGPGGTRCTEGKRNLGKI